jgi:flagellar hook-basal body complex protein FliE
MSQIDMTPLLGEMRRLAAEAQPAALQAERVGGDFAELLKASLEGVNEAQASAEEMAAAFERGDPAIGLPEVMIAIQKASLSFQAMTEVRNRLVSAYQEVMNMPI